MKKIEIPEELYNRLMDMAKAYVNQDSRGTRRPHLFQVREEKRVYKGNNGSYAVWVHDDCVYEDIEDVRENYNDLPDDITDIHSWEFREWAQEKGMYENSYDIDFTYSNAFFTEKACREHIECNGHNLNKPVDYLNYAFRNNDFDTISELLMLLGE